MELIEPIGVVDTYICGVHDVSDMGNGCVRVTLYSDEKFAGKWQRVCVAKIIIPTAALPKAVLKVVTGADVQYPFRVVELMH